MIGIVACTTLRSPRENAVLRKLLAPRNASSAGVSSALSAAPVTPPSPRHIRSTNAAVRSFTGAVLHTQRTLGPFRQRVHLRLDLAADLL